MAENCLTEAWLETGDSAANKVRKMLERFEKRPTLENLRLVERYIEMEFAVLLRIEVRSEPMNIVDHFVAYFQYCGHGRKEGGAYTREASTREPQAFFHRFAQHSGIDGEPSGCCGNRENETVLVDVIKTVENPNIVSLPSKVWLEVEERIFSILPETLWLSAKSGFEILGVVSDRKNQMGRGGEIPGSDHPQMLSQMVEGASQILDSVPGDTREVSRNRVKPHQVLAGLSSLRVYLFSDFIGFTDAEGLDFIMKVTDVLLGPFNFYVDKRDSFVGSQNSGS